MPNAAARHDGQNARRGRRAGLGLLVAIVFALEADAFELHGAPPGAFDVTVFADMGLHYPTSSRSSRTARWSCCTTRPTAAGSSHLAGSW